MDRRDLIGGAVALPAAALLSRLAVAPADAAPPPVHPAAPVVARPAATPFGAVTVHMRARALADQPYKAPTPHLPEYLQHLDYSQYRSIRYKTEKALWRGQGVKFEAEFFHLGFLYNDRVEINEVVNGFARPVAYHPDLFTFGKVRPPTANDLGFAGFRIHYPLNRPDYFDEVCAFLGASYFRAVAKGQGYGLSARGLAIRTADLRGEEFPVFRAFWLERPQPGADTLVIWALLDSESTTGAFRFAIQPGQDTVFDTAMTLYPRVAIAQVGIAPLTSMFYFDANDRSRADDYRAAVHDSNGLHMLTTAGLPLWRPLTNPMTLQFSAFGDPSPRGFGLLQRERAFADYEDLEGHYEKRPSLWVEPHGAWGAGAVDLVEIPTDSETNDNIVAFWRPQQPLAAKSRFDARYRLHWCWSAPIAETLAKVTQTRSGPGHDKGTRLFVVDFAGARLATVPATAKLTARITAKPGKILHPVVEPIDATGHWRLSFELDPGSAKLVEMTARLEGVDAPLSELWLYRWTG
ncbi:MAG: glucan biosynthesis protein [Proteobacteria bacterium]|nr:glucan biosynthesis protein [Pseudomonadota bacterium]